jgi:ureidoglycolate lyase
MNMIELDIQALCASSFAPYGRVIRAAGGSTRSINAGTSTRFDMPDGLSLVNEGGTPRLALFSARPLEPEGPWSTLERHRLGSQSFIPLEGARCIVLVARGEQAPDPASLAAFLADGTAAFTLYPDTWHHPLIALDAGNFVVLERAAVQEDCELASLATPVRLTNRLEK